MIEKAEITDKGMLNHISTTQTIVSYGLLILAIITVSFAVASIVYLDWM